MIFSILALELQEYINDSKSKNNCITIEEVKMSKNSEIYQEAQQYMPGGVSAGGRKNRIYGQPIYIDHADGSRLYSVDGKEYLDYHCCAGAALFGHNHPKIKEGIQKAISNGFFMNFDSIYTLEFAKLFTQLIPTIEQIRFTNSGTEATMAALRLARGYTGRDLIVKIDGHFHGMHELVWYNHGNFPEVDKYGEVMQVIPDSEGIPDKMNEFVKVILFNDIEAVEHVVKKYNGQIAAIILEPISYNCGCYEGRKEYLEQVREICTREGIVLIFDEVITGLRFRPGSAQVYYGIQPDLSTFAKAIGGGLPLAVIGGKKEIMEHFNPTGRIVCSGTCSATQIAVLGGIECIKMALEPNFYNNIEKTAGKLYDGFNYLFTKHGIKGHVRGVGAQFGIYFGCENPEDDFDLRKVIKSYDVEKGKRFIRECLNNGIYFHYYGDTPYPHHSGFTSVHTEKDIDMTLERIDKIFATIK